MTPEQFTYWLQGYQEVTGERPSVEQWQVIKDHLKTVFNKVTPTYIPQSPLQQDPPPPYKPGDWPPGYQIIC